MTDDETRLMNHIETFSAHGKNPRLELASRYLEAVNIKLRVCGR